MGKKNKQKKKRNKKYMQKYTTGGRVDMRNGGRVRAQRGGQIPVAGTQPKPKKPITTPDPSPIDAPQDEIVTGGPVGPGVPFDDSKQGDGEVGTTGTQPLPEDETPPKEESPDQPPEKQDPPGDQTDDTEKNGDDDNQEDDDTQEDDGPQIGDRKTDKTGNIIYEWTDTDDDGVGDSWVAVIKEDPRTPEQKKADAEREFSEERAARVLETGKQAQELAAGVMPEDIPTIPDPKKIDRKDTEITPEEVAQLQMEATKQAEAAKVAAVSPEEVSVIEDVATAAAPEPFDVAKIADEDVAKVPEDAVVKAAQGTVSSEVSDILAEAAGVKEVPAIDAAEVVVEKGALQKRVVGTISESAKVEAAKVAGTTLAKLTRAKKQLRNAGLSEEDIAELGNDPQALEDRLLDFTEEERGIVEGLPEEALVSTQMNQLLEGIENDEIPSWASPAVAAVEQMLAARGLTASSVGYFSSFIFIHA